MLRLEKMSREEFDIVKGKIIADYAKDKVKVGHWLEVEALELSREVLDNILKNGVETPNHYLLNVMEQEKKIGFLWMNEYNGKIFVNDTCIFDKYQKQNYELEFIEIIEKQANNLDIKSVNIHSYGYDKKNLEVYKKMGYDITDIYLNKGL